VFVAYKDFDKIRLRQYDNIMVRIGSTDIATNIVLAPLSGCSDLAFRLIARECGARFCFFEMVDAHSLLYPNPRKFDILKTVDRDTPIAAQLLGADPEVMRDAAQILTDHAQVSLLDINSACPVRKVIKKHAGAALLNTPEILCRIIETLAASLPIPITVKLRSGFTKTGLEALVRLAQMCEASGASALFVHGRTRVQGYSGHVDYAPIRAIKHGVKIPIFGSGDIFTPQLAKQMLTETDCDGVLVARGAFGNPWIFRDIEQYLSTGQISSPQPVSVKKRVVTQHLAYIQQYKECSPTGKVGFMRKVALWYVKGFPHASTLRGQVSALSSYEALTQFIEQHM
jgi:nifR3 family TIM-barrel protein